MKKKYDVFPVLKQLEMDQSEEPFGDLTANDKLQLVRALCEILLRGRKYEELKESVDRKLTANATLIQTHETHIIRLLDMSSDELKEKRKGQPHLQIFDLKKVKTST
jgi:hypothetical protein